jgi:prefoldin subunit 5
MFKQLVLGSGVWGVHVLVWMGLGKAVKHVVVRLDEEVFVKLDEGLYVRKARDGTIELYEEEPHV